MLTELYVTTYQSERALKYIDVMESDLLKEEKESRDVETTKSKLSLFKARLSLLHGNVKACKRDIKNFSTVAGNVSVTVASVLIGVWQTSKNLGSSVCKK